MNDDEKKKLMKLALEKRRQEILDKKQKDFVRRGQADLKSKNLAKGQLDQDLLKVKSSGPDVIKDETMGMSKTQDVFNKVEDHRLKKRLKATMEDAVKRGDKQMIGKLMQVGEKFAKKGLKAIPVIGTVASLAMNPEDAAASVPGLDMADNVGEAPVQDDMMLAERQAKFDYKDSQAAEDKRKALEKLKLK